MNILCYGDSNTWGFPPNGGGRYDEKTRWPAVMASCLGPSYTVFEEALNGRTIGSFMLPGNPRNGLEYLEHLLKRLPPQDLIILYLGINDLFQRSSIGAEEIAQNIESAVKIIRSTDRVQTKRDRPVPDVLLLTPLPINLQNESAGPYRLLIVKSESFYELYRNIAERHGVHIIDTGSIISASPTDGVHIEAEEHRTLGKKLCAFIDQHYP